MHLAGVVFLYSVAGVIVPQSHATNSGSAAAQRESCLLLFASATAFGAFGLISYLSGLLGAIGLEKASSAAFTAYFGMLGLTSFNVLAESYRSV